MGVSGLLTFLREGRNSLSQTEVLTATLKASLPHPEDGTYGHSPFDVDFGEREEVSLVIDGWAFIWSLYNDNLPWATGGEYHAFALLIERVIIAWDYLGIRPYFVFDGPTPANKHDLVLSRYASALRTAQLFHLTSSTSRSAPNFSKSVTILPPLIYNCTLETLQALGLEFGSQIFVLPEGEADGYCVSLASELEGWVVSNDTDEVILGAGAGGEGYKGFIPIDMMQWTLVENISATMENPVNSEGAGSMQAGDDGFQPVPSPRKKKRPGAPLLSHHNITGGITTFAQHLLPPILPSPPPPTHTYKLSLIIASFHPADLATRLRIPASHLPLLASLLGTDHSPPEAPGLFFEHRLARAEHIELVARAIRECLDPKSGAHKKARWKKGSNGLSTPSKGKGSVIPAWDDAASVAGSSTSSPREEPPVTAGDHAYEFIRLVIVNLLLRPPLNEDTLDRLITGMIDATCHYILPPSPTSLALHARMRSDTDMSMSSASIRIARNDRCCSMHPYCECLDPEGGVPIWTCPCLRGPVSSTAERSSTEHSGIRSRYALARSAGCMSAFSAFQEPDRSYMHSMLEHPDGSPLRSSEASRHTRKVAWELISRGMGLFGSRGDFAGSIHGESLSSPETTDGELEVGAEPPSPDKDTPAEAPGDPHVVWEYMRASSSVKMDAFPLKLDLKPIKSGLDLSLGPSPTQMLTGTPAERWATMRRLCDSDIASLAGLPSDVQLLVIAIRTSITRAAATSRSRSTARLWTHDHVIRSILAGLISLRQWTSGPAPDAQTPPDDPLILEGMASSIISQITAVSMDLLCLGQALLLPQPEETDDPTGPSAFRFRPYTYQDGTIWHRTLSAKELSMVDEATEDLLLRCFQAVSDGLQNKILGWHSAVRHVKSGTKFNKNKQKLSSPVTSKAKVNGSAFNGLRSKYDVLLDQ